MFKAKSAFSGFSVDDLAKAKEFYTGTLGLKVEEEGAGLGLHLPGVCVGYHVCTFLETWFLAL